MKLSGVITIPFHIGDFLSGTMHMDTLEKGAYIMLLMAHYQIGEQGLPNDDKKLSRICGVSSRIWPRIKPTLQEKFEVKNGAWIHKKCVEVLQNVHDNSSKQRAKALKRHNSDDAAALPLQCQPKPKPKPIKNNSENEGDYFYQGDVFRLNNKDKDRWLKTYSNLNEKTLMAECQKAEDYYKSKGNTDNLFFKISKWLDRVNKQTKPKNTGLTAKELDGAYD